MKPLLVTSLILAQVRSIGYPLHMQRKAMFLLFLSVLGLAALNLGTVRRTEDPIRDTQTSPILYEQKKEEEKDGKKGPLMYNVKYVPREAFFIDPPYAADKKNSEKKTVAEETPASTGTTDWWEEQPAAPQAPSVAAEPVATPVPEPPPQETKDQDLGIAEQQPVPAADSEKAPAGKGDDYWW